MCIPVIGSCKIALESLHRVDGELASLQCFQSNFTLYGGKNRLHVAV
jgi:hypothetical protein